MKICQPLTLVWPTVVDIADVELLLPLIQFLTADSCVVANFSAVQTTETILN